MDWIELANEYSMAIERFQTLVQLATNADWARCQTTLQQADRDWSQLLASLTDGQRQGLQPYHTEIDKEIRLLQTDVMMLKAAKQPQTQQQRLQRLRERGDRLVSYLETLVAKGAELISGS